MHGGLSVPRARNVFPAAYISSDITSQIMRVWEHQLSKTMCCTLGTEWTSRASVVTCSCLSSLLFPPPPSRFMLDNKHPSHSNRGPSRHHYLAPSHLSSCALLQHPTDSRRYNATNVRTVFHFVLALPLCAYISAIRSPSPALRRSPLLSKT